MRFMPWAMHMFEIEMHLTEQQYEEIYRWCIKNLARREGLVWQVAVPMGPHISKLRRGWSFTRQEDYVLFKMTWCYEQA
mgnify:CR=1 FL=1